jgi:PAS domain S-box-containing protein
MAGTGSSDTAGGAQEKIGSTVRESLSLLRTIVAAAPCALVLVDGAGRIALANAECERLFGYQPGELLGRPLETLVPERFRERHPAFRRGFGAAPQARPMGAGREIFGRRKDGSEFPVEIGLNPIRTARGLHVLSAIVDLTERTRMAEARAAFARELERRVEERTAELSRSHDALARSNVELRQFAFVASHDLQAPLRHIAGFVQLLQQRLSDDAEPEILDLFQRIVASVERMRRLITDLLAYARVESRERPFEPTALRDALEDAVTILRPSIDAAAAVVTTGDLPVVHGDRTQLAQLLQNLIGNALKYHGDVSARIHVDAERGDAGWTVSVRDNGIGIDARHHERIFEAFRRLHGEHKYPGTGIGLAVCRRIVERHGGRIWVESAPGHGAVFRFMIPTRDAGAP